MPNVLLEYDAIVRAVDDTRWLARSVGRRRDDGMYEAWLEFEPATGSHETLRSGRETTQPDRGAALYWASGLTTAYLEGALERAVAITEDAGTR